MEDTLRHNDEMREQESVRMAQNNIENVLIPRPYFPQMTRWKHCLVTHMIQEQGKYQPNQ